MCPTFTKLLKNKQGCPCSSRCSQVVSVISKPPNPKSAKVYSANEENVQRRSLHTKVVQSTFQQSCMEPDTTCESTPSHSTDCIHCTNYYVKTATGAPDFHLEYSLMPTIPNPKPSVLISTYVLASVCKLFRDESVALRLPLLAARYCLCCPPATQTRQAPQPHS